MKGDTPPPVIQQRSGDGTPPCKEPRRRNIRRPWTRWVDQANLDRVMVVTQRNYKVFADSGTTTANLVRTLTILDTGAGNNFIHEDALPTEYEKYLKLGPLPNVCDANGNRLEMSGVASL